MITVCHATTPPHLSRTIFWKHGTKTDKNLSILLGNIPFYTVGRKNCTQKKKCSKHKSKMISAQHAAWPPYMSDTVFWKIPTKMKKNLSIFSGNIPFYTVRWKNRTQKPKSDEAKAKLITALYVTRQRHLSLNIFRKRGTKIVRNLCIFLGNILLYTVTLKNRTQTPKSRQDKAKMITAQYATQPSHLSLTIFREHSSKIV